MRKSFLSPLVVGGIVLAGVVTSGEEAPVSRFEGEIEVSEVLLDVLVTDKDGNLVTGLTKDDFVVEEDGEQLTLSGVSFYSTRYSIDGRSGALDGEIPASRYFIFFFHDQRFFASGDSRLLRRQLRAARDSREWIETEMKPSDWVAVVGYDVKLKVHQDFTQDREAITRALSDAARGEDPGNNWPSRRQAIPSTRASLFRSLPVGKKLRKETRVIYDAIRLLAEATGHIVGRKNLLLFSTGFGVVDGSGIFARPDRRYYPDLEQALNDNHVAIYTMDLVPVGSRHSQEGFLNTLAADSGGLYYHNIINFLTPLRKIANENIGYYLLSYRAEHPVGEVGYQKVSIRMRERRLKVRAPRGYRYGD
ncbi:MAG: VWA domain-containing protein [Thermoanaerobaculia bacterium]